MARCTARTRQPLLEAVDGKPLNSAVLVGCNELEGSPATDSKQMVEIQESFLTGGNVCKACDEDEAELCGFDAEGYVCDLVVHVLDIIIMVLGDAPSITAVVDKLRHAIRSLVLST